MKLEVLRYRSEADFTLGILSDVTPTSSGEQLVTRRGFLCYTLEDEFRLSKVSSETRIPAGTYAVTLRQEGRFHGRYNDKFPDIHDGMLWVRDVPSFKWILIHIGNMESDTAGCLLVGSAPTADGRLTDSTRAYKRGYVHILEALKRGEKVEITYVDFDTP